MQIDSYIPITQAKTKLLDVVREIHRNDNTVAITKNGIPETVLLSIEQYESIRATMAILTDETAMAQLRVSMQEEADGKTFVDLEDL